MPLAAAVATLGSLIKSNAPKILMISSFILAGGAVGSAIVETPRAMRDYDEKLEEQKMRGVDLNSPRAKTERAGAVGKHYILTGILLAGSFVCGAKSLGTVTKSLQSVTNGYLCLDKIHQTYQEHNRKVLGAEKEELFRMDMYKDQDRANGYPDEGLITHTGNGETLFKDDWTGRYFYSSKNAVDNSFLTMNSRIISEHFITTNELQIDLGLEPTDSGKSLGWDLKDGLIGYTYTSVLWDDGRQCIHISYDIKPERRYDPDDYY